MATTFKKIEPATTKLGWVGTGVMGRWDVSTSDGPGYG